MLEKVISVERENVTFECSNNIGFLLGIDFRCRCRFVVTDVVVAIVIVVVVDVVDKKNFSGFKWKIFVSRNDSYPWQCSHNRTLRT